jgi:hypothetical protein
VVEAGELNRPQYSSPSTEKALDSPAKSGSFAAVTEAAAFGSPSSMNSGVPSARSIMSPFSAPQPRQVEVEIASYRPSSNR